MRICRAQYLFFAVVVLTGLTALLSGCGAKGPLELPPEQQQQAQQALLQSQTTPD